MEAAACAASIGERAERVLEHVRECGGWTTARELVAQEGGYFAAAAGDGATAAGGACADEAIETARVVRMLVAARVMTEVPLAGDAVRGDRPFAARATAAQLRSLPGDLARLRQRTEAARRRVRALRDKLGLSQASTAGKDPSAWVVSRRPPPLTRQALDQLLDPTKTPPALAAPQVRAAYRRLRKCVP
jgi:hypothetical protein